MRISILHNASNMEMSFDMQRHIVVLGRETTKFINDLDNKNAVSRRHVSLIDNGSGWIVIRDLGSTNGTKISAYTNAPCSKMARTYPLESSTRMLAENLSAIYIPGFTIRIVK